MQLASVFYQCSGNRGAVELKKHNFGMKVRAKKELAFVPFQTAVLSFVCATQMLFFSFLPLPMRPKGTLYRRFIETRFILAHRSIN